MVSMPASSARGTKVGHWCAFSRRSADSKTGRCQIASTHGPPPNSYSMVSTRRTSSLDHCALDDLVLVEQQDTGAVAAFDVGGGEVHDALQGLLNRGPGSAAPSPRTRLPIRQTRWVIPRLACRPHRECRSVG